MSDVLILNADGRPLSEVPLSTVVWTEAMRLVYLNKVIVLKEYDNWVVRSQYLDLKVPSIVIMSKQVKWSKHLNYSRNNVLLRDDFTCQLQITNRCKSDKGKGHKMLDLTLDHVIPKSNGGKTTWLNVCTACKTCNGVKGNDARIVPKKMPHKPTYYEILAKKKTMALQIRDPEWKHYIDWPEDLIKLIPQPFGPAVIDNDFDASKLALDD